MTTKAGRTGNCPNCRTGVRFEQAFVVITKGRQELPESIDILTPAGFSLEMIIASCPACGYPIIGVKTLRRPNGSLEDHISSTLWPDSPPRTVPTEVEAQDPAVAADFREAALIFSKSRKASAALSRRCLQAVLREMGGTKGRDLSAQIDEVLENLPSQLAANIDAIRQIGNFAAHPMKSTATGEIVEVEPGEAEWLLDVIEDLFEFYYVGPARSAARREALNKKLEELGKPALKTPSVNG